MKACLVPRRNHIIVMFGRPHRGDIIAIVGGTHLKALYNKHKLQQVTARRALFHFILHHRQPACPSTVYHPRMRSRRVVPAIILLFVLFIGIAQVVLLVRRQRSESDAGGGETVSSPRDFAILKDFRPAACSVKGQQCFAVNTAGSGVPSLHPEKEVRQCDTCPASRSFCFMGTCPCHPGWTGQGCDIWLKDVGLPNPWYSEICPNLSPNAPTFNKDASVADLGGEYSKPGGTRCQPLEKQDACAYLCFSNQMYGVAAVPISLWRAAQDAETQLWKSLGAPALSPNDRAAEHWRGFGNFACIRNASLGRAIEVGAGPWTQIKGILHVRQELSVSELTVFEPGADSYMRDVPSCSYRTGRLERFDSRGAHAFPVVVQSHGGELLVGGGHYDSLVSINVLEHVQDAFRYLTALVDALRPGGLLIFHERYYTDTEVLRGDLWHPVRIKRVVLDAFLSRFDILFNNCDADYGGRLNETGYYVIALKR